jgi:hypothetical protein
VDRNQNLLKLTWPVVKKDEEDEDEEYSSDTILRAILLKKL